MIECQLDAQTPLCICLRISRRSTVSVESSAKLVEPFVRVNRQSFLQDVSKEVVLAPIMQISRRAGTTLQHRDPLLTQLVILAMEL